MKDFFKLKTLIILYLMFVLSISMSLIVVLYDSAKNLKPAMAAIGDNVFGWAWSDNYGWISFNSLNCDKNSNTYVDTPAITPFCDGLDNATTPVRNYGVKLDWGSGDFSGYAWNQHVGWIYFGPDADIAGYGQTLSSSAPSSPKIWANYDSVSNEITGWAKILSLGDDGWIKMRNDINDAGGVVYGTKLNTGSAEIEGWAWNGNATDNGVGWISFNCVDSGTVGCATSDYQVTVTGIPTPPTANNLTAPNWSFIDACNDGQNAKTAVLKWDFVPGAVGKTQSAYRVQVDNDPDFSSTVYDSDKVTGAQGQTARQVTLTSELDYHTPYYWRVKVWDNDDSASIDYVGYNSLADTDNDDGYPYTFTTYNHEFPNPSIVWTPTRPSKAEDTLFNGTGSAYFSIGSESSPITCDLNCTYAWLFQNASTTSSDLSTVVNHFDSTGLFNITLTVKDNDDYICTSTKAINVKASLPNRTEVK